MQSTIVRALTGLLATCALVGGLACSGDGNGDQDAIEETIRAFEKAWNDQDYDAFAAVHTDQGLRSQLSDTEEDLETEEGRREAFSVFSGEDKAVISKIGDVEVDGDQASVAIEGYNESREEPAPSSVVLGITLAMAKDGDAWKIDGLEFGAAAVPEGAQVVRVQANEFAFALLDEPGSGNIAFEIENVGDQPHHVVIEMVPEDLDIEEALQSEEDPEGLVHIGATPPWEPGDTATVVFTEDLGPGRYVMLCFMPDTDDPEGAPHAFKGMWKDFHID